MPPTYEKHAAKRVTATILTLLIVAGSVVLIDHLESAPTASASKIFTPTTTSTTTSQAPSTTTTPTTTSTNTATAAYKDGTYSAAINYYVPNGYEAIKVSLTLQNGNITSSSVQNSEGDPTSAAFQQDFASSYKSYVVGKSLNNLQLSVIAGASDTTRAFADALSQIANQAQA